VSTLQEQQAIELLQATGNYRISQRLHAPSVYNTGKPETPRIGLVVDTETTGLNQQHDNIIELGFVAFEYDAASGLIYRVLHTYDGFEDPKEPLTDIVKELTGIDDAMLHGQHLDDDEIQHWFQKASLVIAHNASFDRAMLERRIPQAKQSAWACSFADIDWQAEGISGRKLDYLAFCMGFFFDGHRAVNDAQATLHLLSYRLPKSQHLALGQLLQQARKHQVRIFALAAPYDKKDMLKERGYRWLADFQYAGKKGVWSCCLDEEQLEDEEAWLSSHIYTGKKAAFRSQLVTAQERYSKRELMIQDDATRS